MNLVQTIIPYHANILRMLMWNQWKTLKIPWNFLLLNGCGWTYMILTYVTLLANSFRLTATPTGKPSMLQQGVDVETTTSKNRVTINMPRFMLTLKNANTNFLKKTALHITPGAAVKTVLFRLKNNDFHEMCYFVWENKKIRNFEKEHVAAGWWSWSNNEQKKADYQHVPFHATVKINCKYQ